MYEFEGKLSGRFDGYSGDSKVPFELDIMMFSKSGFPSITNMDIVKRNLIHLETIKLFLLTPSKYFLRVPIILDDAASLDTIE